MSSTIAAPLPLPPGPPAAQSLRWLRRLRIESLEAAEQLASEYGDLSRIKLPGSSVVLVRGAEAAHRVLVSGQDHYAKGEIFKLFRPALGLGLVTSDGDIWRTSRKLVQPLFAKRNLGLYAGHMSAAAAAAMQRWEREWVDGRQIQLDHEMLHVGLDTVGRALISGDLTGDSLAIGDAMGGALEQISPMMGNPRVILAQLLLRRDVPDAARLGLPGRWRRYTDHSATIINICSEIIDRRYASGHGDRDDLLRLLMESEDEETGQQLPRQQVIDELRTFIGAGHETTAHGLTWMFYLLAKHSDLRARVEGEVDEVLAGARPDVTSAEQLPYLTACFQEAMRLYPPAWVIPRAALQDDEVAGYRIPKGTDLLVSVWATHRDPSVYEDPLRFDPQRWLGDAPKQRPRFSYLPFGGGRRACVGQGFAMLNARILGAMIIQKYRFELVDDKPIELQTSITLRAANGVPVTAHRR